MSWLRDGLGLIGSVDELEALARSTDSTDGAKASRCLWLDIVAYRCWHTAAHTAFERIVLPTTWALHVRACLCTAS